VSSDEAPGPGVDAVGPADGDLLLVRASRGADGVALPAAPARWAVVVWGPFSLADAALTGLPLPDARIQARLAASKRGRTAWDGSGPRLLRLPRVPLVFVTGAGTFTLSTDASDPEDPRETIRWRSESHLTDRQVRGRLAQEGFPADVVAHLVDGARDGASRP
jgi:hypothetical protein